MKPISMAVWFSLTTFSFMWAGMEQVVSRFNEECGFGTARTTNQERRNIKGYVQGITIVMCDLSSERKEVIKS